MWHSTFFYHLVKISCGSLCSAFQFFFGPKYLFKNVISTFSVHMFTLLLFSPGTLVPRSSACVQISNISSTTKLLKLTFSLHILLLLSGHIFSSSLATVCFVSTVFIFYWVQHADLIHSCVLTTNKQCTP